LKQANFTTKLLLPLFSHQFPEDRVAAILQQVLVQLAKAFAAPDPGKVFSVPLETLTFQ